MMNRSYETCVLITTRLFSSISYQPRSTISATGRFVGGLLAYGLWDAFLNVSDESWITVHDVVYRKLRDLSCKMGWHDGILGGTAEIAVGNGSRGR